MVRPLIVCFCAFLAAEPAFAFCRDDLPLVKQRIDHYKISERGRYALAMRWWQMASEEEADEVACDNDLLKAQRALTDPWPECLQRQQHSGAVEPVGPNQPECFFPPGSPFSLLTPKH